MSAGAAPMVSVVTPTYNRVDLLTRTIRSVLAQEFTDFEYIIVDDASTDGTESVVESFARSDPRIRYFRLPKNSGHCAAPKNHGVRHALGKYVAFVDSDDLWLPEKLSFQIAHMERHPQVALSHCNAYVIRGKSEEPQALYWKKPPHGENEKVYRKMLRTCHVIQPSAVVRKECLDEAEPFKEEDDPRYAFAEDWLMWIKIARKHRFSYLDRPMVLFREHPDRITGSRKRTAQGDYYLYERYWKDMGLSLLGRRAALSRTGYYVAKIIYFEEDRFPGKELRECLHLNPFNLKVYAFLVRAGFLELARRIRG